MKRRNLNDPVLSPLDQAVHVLGTQSPLGHSSITVGGLRVASNEGLTVEGSILGVANNELGLPAHIDWRGTAVFQNGLSVGPLWNNTNGALIVGETGDPRLAHINGPLTARGHVFFPGDLTEEQATFIVGEDGMSESDMPVWLHGIAEESSAAGMRALAINSYNEVISVPFPTGSGGGGGMGPPGTNGLTWPYSLDLVTSEFGPRESPGSGGSTNHMGMDFGVGCGVAIPAAGNGTVQYAGWFGNSGNYVEINHGGGLVTGYGHMSGFAVSVGDTVSTGTTIGYIGTTGASTGCHLHFETIVNGVQTNPRLVV